MKNFSLLHDERGFVLSPAYDLLPNVSGSVEHDLHLGYSYVCPSRAALVAFGRSLGITCPERILEEVLEGCGGFRATCEAFQVPERDTQRLALPIEAQIQRLAQ